MPDPSESAPDRVIAGLLEAMDHDGNRETLRTYLRIRERVDAATAHTRQNDIQALTLASRFLGKPFEDATRDDLMAWEDWLLKDAQLKRGARGKKGYAASSVNTYKICAHRFFTYLHNRELYLKGSRVRKLLKTPDCVAWMSFTAPGSRKDLPVKELLNETDVRALIDVCTHPRDKAFVACLYESAARLGEFLALNVENVEFDEYGAVVLIRTGKTGGRRIRLITAAPLLRDYLNHHPFRDHTDAPLWHTLEHSSFARTLAALAKERDDAKRRVALDDVRLKKQSVASVLRKIKTRAGVRKRVNPHAFRHARCTVLARILGEAELRQIAGWAKASRMPSVYDHLSGGESEAKLLRAYGKTPETKPQESPLAPTRCPWCDFECGAGSKFCARCGKPVDLRVAITEDKLDQVIGKATRDFMAAQATGSSEKKDEAAKQILELMTLLKKRA